MRQNHVSDVVAADREQLQVDWVLSLGGHLDVFQMDVHSDVDAWVWVKRVFLTDDGPLDDGAVFELDGHLLAFELH